MANSRSRRNAEAFAGTGVEQALRRFFSEFRKDSAPGVARVAVALSGGMDSVSLLHAAAVLATEFPVALSALHVNHGLSPNARRWESFCRALCRDLQVPLIVRRVRVGTARGRGLEAAARDARRAVFAAARVDTVVLAHHRDDQAETVLLNLLRGAGPRGASGMRPLSTAGDVALARPLLEIGREEIAAYAAAQDLAWIEDESNLDEGLRRNFIRHSVGPLLATRYPKWRESLARSARLFAQAQGDERAQLRLLLELNGLRAPSERGLAEMLSQIRDSRPGARVAIAHDGAMLRMFRGRLIIASDPSVPAQVVQERVIWRGERSLSLPAFAGTLHMRPGTGIGLDRGRLAAGQVTVRARSGGEHLQLGARQPHRTLKNLYQEAGIPHWERQRLPLIYCGETLVWAAGLGIQAGYAALHGAAGFEPAWVPEAPLKGRRS